MISKSKHSLRGSGETLLQPYACLGEWHVGPMKLRDAHDASLDSKATAISRGTLELSPSEMRGHFITPVPILISLSNPSYDLELTPVVPDMSYSLNSE